MNALPAILFAAVLLAINAFFVSAEFALISSRRDRLDALIAQGKRAHAQSSMPLSICP